MRAELFSKRQDSLQVSTMWQWWVLIRGLVHTVTMTPAHEAEINEVEFLRKRPGTTVLTRSF